MSSERVKLCSKNIEILTKVENTLILCGDKRVCYYWGSKKTQIAKWVLCAAKAKSKKQKKKGKRKRKEKHSCDKKITTVRMTKWW